MPGSAQISNFLRVRLQKSRNNLMPGQTASRSHLPLIVMPQRCSVPHGIGIGDQDGCQARVFCNLTDPPKISSWRVRQRLVYRHLESKLFLDYFRFHVEHPDLANVTMAPSRANWTGKLNRLVLNHKTR